MEKKDGKAIDKEITKESDDSFEEVDQKMKDAANFRKRPNETSGQHNLPEMGCSRNKKLKQIDDHDELSKKLKAGADIPVFDVGSEDDHVKMESTGETNQSGQSSDVVARDIEKGKDVVVSSGDTTGSETETDSEFEEVEKCAQEMSIKWQELIEVRKTLDRAFKRFIDTVTGGGGGNRYGDVEAGDDMKLDQPGESRDVGTGSNGPGDQNVPVFPSDSGEGKQESQELKKQEDAKNDLGKIEDDLQHDVSTNSEED